MDELAKEAAKVVSIIQSCTKHEQLKGAYKLYKLWFARVERLYPNIQPTSIVWVMYFDGQMTASFVTLLKFIKQPQQ